MEEIVNVVAEQRQNTPRPVLDQQAQRRDKKSGRVVEDVGKCIHDGCVLPADLQQVSRPAAMMQSVRRASNSICELQPKWSYLQPERMPEHDREQENDGFCVKKDEFCMN